MSAELAPSRGSRELHAWRRSVFAVFGISGFGLSNWLARVPAARDELHATAFQMGLLALGIAIGSIAGFTIAGRIGGRLAPRTVIAGALGLSALGLAAAGGAVLLPGGVGWAMAALVLFGTGNGTCNVVMNIEGTRIEHAQGTPVMPYFHAVFSVGAAAGAGLGALCAAAGVTPTAQLLAVAVCMAAALPLVTRALSRDAAAPSRTRAEAQPQPMLRERSAWSEPRTLLIGTVVLGMSFANGAANDWIALGMVDGHGAAQGTAAATINVFSVAVVAARLFGTRALMAFGRARVVQASALLALAGLAVFIFTPSPAWAFAGATLWGLGVALAFPLGMSAAGDEPERAPQRIAVVAAIGYAGSLVGPPLIGFVAGGTGILHALLIVPVLVAVAGLTAPVLRDRAAARRLG